jgi:dolichol-phosphate mannosyltransferase
VHLSVIIPCFQEERALEAWPALLAQLAADEILFVDDGSTDRTAEMLMALAGSDRRVRVLTHAHNRGVGAAMRTGLHAAEGEVVVVYDADATYPLTDIPKLVDALEEGVDVVTATPFGKDGALDDVPFHRRVLSQGAVGVYKRAIGPAARDISVFTCAFRAYRRAVIADLEFVSDGFPAAGEILGRLLLAGRTVIEVPSTLSARTAGESKMRILRTIRGHLKVARILRKLGARVTGE